MLAHLLRTLTFVLCFSFVGLALAQTTVVLQQGLNSYTGSTDAGLSIGSPNTNRDVNISIRQPTMDSAVIRFAIFAREGGPVPDGAIINSATLSLYKFDGPDAVVRASRLLKSWNESQVTWNATATGTSWTSAGAQGSGSDYSAIPDGEGSIGDAVADGCAAAPYPLSCWLHINVTPGVQAFRNGSPNHGWKVAQLSSSSDGTYKNFNSSENGNFPNLRPKLTVIYTVPSGASVTLMEDLNGYAGTTDAFITEGQPNTNKETAALSIRGESTDSALVRFKIFAAEGGPVPDGATITSATLSLYKFSGPDAVMKASRVFKDWVESQVTWNSAATGTSWSLAGALTSESDYSEVPDGEGSVGDAAANGCGAAPYPSACWLNIDVTDGLRSFAAGEAQNFGWKIAQVSSSIAGNYKHFNSSENGNFPTLRPKLTITYVPIGCAAPTARLSATPLSGGNPLNVTFSAAASTDGGAPITSLRLRFGDDTEVNWSDKNQAQQHSYTSNGPKTATLTATNSCGTSVAVTQMIQVGVRGPTADFTASPQPGEVPAGSQTLNVTFNASASAEGDASIRSLRLHFGHDNAEATWDSDTQSQSHAYPVGTYDVTLTVTDANGLSASAKKTIRVDATSGSCPTGLSRPYHAAPVNGSPIAIAAGTTTEFEAEHFNCGGEGQGYHDVSDGNNAGQIFRASESVEVIASPTGLAVNQFAVDEWLTYTLSIPASGTYDIGILASASPSGGGPGKFRLEIDGTPLAGDVEVPLTSGWEEYEWVTKAGVPLSAGIHVLKLVSVAAYFRADKLRLVPSAPPTACNSGSSRPYEGAPVSGSAIQVSPNQSTTFEAEHFNCGGEGQGYHETTSTNNSGQTFRADESVELIAAPGGLAVNQFDLGEWIAYTINVASTGNYDVAIRASASASGGGTGAFSLEVDGTPVAGNVAVPVTDGWEDYQWVVKASVPLTAGKRVLKLAAAGTYFRIDKMMLTPSSSAGGGGGGGGGGGEDTCSDANLSFCARFEQAETQFTGPGVGQSNPCAFACPDMTCKAVTTTSMPSRQLAWRAENRGCGAPAAISGHDGDRSDDSSRIALVDGGRDGSKAIRFTTREKDVCVHPGGSNYPECETNYTGWNERSMLTFDSGDLGIAQGKVQWWTHSVFLPFDFQMTSRTLFFQFNQFGGGGLANFAVDVYIKNGVPIIRSSTFGDGGVPDTGGAQYVDDVWNIKGQCIHDDVQRGVWYDFVHRIRWSSAGDGSHETWMRQGGGAVKKVLHYTGINTLHAKSYKRWMSIGNYHLYQSGDSSIVHDRIRGGSTYESVKPPSFPTALPGNVVRCERN